MENSLVTAPKRIQSVDLLRGAVMIIMAIDHVRVYSGLPAGGSTAGIFFTRWITHYCAPTFVFFAGTSAFLFFQKNGNISNLRKFLVTRGFLLVFLELVVIRFFWMFNLDFANFSFTGVIWMLGWCMVLLAPFVTLKPSTMAVIGVSMIFFQQVFQYVPLILPDFLDPYWSFFYPSSFGASGATMLSGGGGPPVVNGLSIFYVIIPWIGLMMTGFAFGKILSLNAIERNKLCLRIGLCFIALFLIGGIIFALRNTDNETPFLFKVLGQQKYPPSQLYLLMTIGPIIALIPFAEKAKGWFANVMIIVGRVPMFYYLLHILLIHLSAFIVNMILYNDIHQEWYVKAPFVGMNEDVRWGLPILYMVWAIDVVLLFFLCKWYERFKRENPQLSILKYF